MTHHVVLNHILSVRSRFLLNTTYCQPFKDCTLYNDYSSLRNASHTLSSFALNALQNFYHTFTSYFYYEHLIYGYIELANCYLFRCKK